MKVREKSQRWFVELELRKRGGGILVEVKLVRQKNTGIYESQ